MRRALIWTIVVWTTLCLGAAIWSLVDTTREIAALGELGLAAAAIGILFNLITWAAVTVPLALFALLAGPPPLKIRTARPPKRDARRREPRLISASPPSARPRD